LYLIMLQAVEQIKDILVKEYNPDKIILFGSQARGNAQPDSDIDMLVISDAEKHIPRYKRGLNVRIKLAQVPVPKDILFYSLDEVARWRGVKHTFVDTVFNEGIVLYER